MASGVLGVTKRGGSVLRDAKCSRSATAVVKRSVVWVAVGQRSVNELGLEARVSPVDLNETKRNIERPLS